MQTMQDWAVTMGNLFIMLLPREIGFNGKFLFIKVGEVAGTEQIGHVTVT